MAGRTGKLESRRRDAGQRPADGFAHRMRAHGSTATTCHDPDEAFLARYLDWREECDAVACAYAKWMRSPRAGREVAFERYRVALDREATAARAYRRVASIQMGR
jgi:hypothetical protein